MFSSITSSYVGLNAFVDFFNHFLLRLHLADFDFVDFLHRVHQFLHVLLVPNCQCHPFVVMAPCSTHSMQVEVYVDVIVVFGAAYVDDEHCTSNIHPSGHDVRAHENVSLLVPELPNDFFFLFVLQIFFLPFHDDLGRDCCTGDPF